MISFIVGSLVFSALIIYIWLLFTSLPNVRAKLIGMPVSFIHLVLSRDNKWKKPTGQAETLALALRGGDAVKRKRLYFVRHGESLWNQVFNRGLNFGIVVRFFSCLLEELRLFALPDSMFWDSPLSPLGIQQAVQMSSWLQHESVTNVHAGILRGESDSVICSSNLRRSVATILTGFSGRLLRRPTEKVFVVSSAQEVTRNIDGYSLSAPRGVPSASHIETEIPELDKVVDVLYGSLDGQFNSGNKPLFDSSGLKRMNEFAHWAFTSTACRDKPTVILGGHSLWFREFFKAFLPTEKSHTCKTKKIVNCGIVAFDLLCVGAKYVIDPESIQVVYGGFEGAHTTK